MRYLSRRVFLIVTISILLLFTSTEFAARLWLTAQIQAALMPDGRPWAYKDSRYWGDEFQAERRGIAGAIYYVGDVRKGEYTSKYISLHDGWRGTTDQPSTWRHTVWLVGRSTVYDEDVPDADTKASYLQRLLKADGLRIMNISEGGANIIVAVSWLKHLDIRPDDTVIFYGFSPFLGKTLYELREATLAGQLCQTLTDHLSQLALGAAYCQLSDHWLGASKMDPNTLNTLVAGYKAYTIRAHDIVVARQAHFVDFLEPSIYSMPMSPLEQKIIAVYPGLVPDHEAAWQDYYPHFQAAQAELSHNGIDAYDLLHALDPLRKQGVIVYVDQVHTTERANAVIAQAIYTRIWQTF